MTMRFAIDSLAEGRKVVLAVGVLDMDEELSSVVDHEGASSQEISDCPHAARVGVGERKSAASDENGNLLGIDSVVLGFTSMDGFHVKGMA